MEGTEQLQIGERYQAQINEPQKNLWAPSYLYTGLQPGPDSKEYEFIYAPTFMSVS